jgi:hypothetical protein
MTSKEKEGRYVDSKANMRGESEGCEIILASVMREQEKKALTSLLMLSRQGRQRRKRGQRGISILAAALGGLSAHDTQFEVKTSST